MEQTNKTVETKKLLEMVESSPEVLKKMIVENKSFPQTLSLQEFLQNMLVEHEISIAEVVRISLLSKTFVYQIFSGTRNPSRDMLLRVGLAMSLTIDEMQHLLTIAHQGSLYPKIRRDAAILCCMALKMDLAETNEFLEAILERTLI